jgi:hypothetical protein
MKPYPLFRPLSRWLVHCSEHDRHDGTHRTKFFDVEAPRLRHRAAFLQEVRGDGEIDDVEFLNALYCSLFSLFSLSSGYVFVCMHMYAYMARASRIFDFHCSTSYKFDVSSRTHQTLYPYEVD